MALPKSYGLGKGWPIGPGIGVPAPVVLGTLSLSGSLQIGTSTSGTIIGASSGSTIVGNIPGITVNSGARTYSGTPTGSAGSISNALVETLSGATNSPKSTSLTVAAASTTLTSFPASRTLIYDLDPNTISPADGTRVTSITDAVGSLAATAPSIGPVFKTNIANGRPALRFAGNDAERLTLGRPAALTTPLSTAAGYSIIIVFKNATSFGPMFGDNYSSGINMCAGAAGVAQNATVAGGSGGKSFTTSPADPATNVHTLIYSGVTGDRVGRSFLDGYMFQCTEHALGATYDILIGNSANNGTLYGAFSGDILSIRIVSGWWSPAECLQAHFWACTRFGKALPTAGMSYFPIFDGDSITYGVGSATGSDGSFPSQIGALRAWPLGAFANVGKPGAQVASGTSTAPSGGDGTKDNLIDHGAVDVDAYKAVVGLPIKIIFGEWYNQGAGGGTNAAGVTLAGNNRTYAAARKTFDPTCSIIGWTSTSSYDREGASRDGFNASLVSTPGSIDTVIPIHTNSTIGVDGAAGATTGQTTYFNDGVHPRVAGYTVMRDLIAPSLP